MSRSWKTFSLGCKYADKLNRQWHSPRRISGRFRSLRQKPWLQVLQGWAEAGPHPVSRSFRVLGTHRVSYHSHQLERHYCVPSFCRLLLLFRPIGKGFHRAVFDMGRSRRKGAFVCSVGPSDPFVRPSRPWLCVRWTHPTGFRSKLCPCDNDTVCCRYRYHHRCRNRGSARNQGNLDRISNTNTDKLECEAKQKCVPEYCWSRYLDGCRFSLGKGDVYAND